MKKVRSTFLTSLTGLFLLNSALVCAESAKLVLGTKVEKHVVQNERDHFAFHDGQVWAQVELKPSTDGNVTFVWTRDGKPYTEFKAKTKKSDRYRTQAFVTARPGKWHVAVKSEANVVLAEKDFVVDGVDAVKESNPSSTKPKTRSEKEKVDRKAVVSDGTKAVSGINEALKAMNPTDAKPEVKSDAKTDAKATETKAADAKADAKPTETKAVDAKADAKPVETKAVDTKADAKPTETKAAGAKAETPKA